jgi:ABC-2 type transport system ATP-binding protein
METNIAIQVAHAHKVFGARPQLPLTRLHTGGDSATAAGPARSTVALHDVSFDVRRGEIFGLLGPNGSGKSTLIRLIATLLQPDGGHVRVFGHDAASEPQAVQALINRVASEANFFKKLSPVENLLYGARLYGVRPGETRRLVVDLLARLGLRRDDLFRPMEVLSRGAQQKVAIARAFLSEPRVLLLDEPTTGLDPRSRRDVQDFIRSLRDEHGTTVLLTTHDMQEAESLCDRLAIVDHGRLVALDTPARLRQSVARPSPAAGSAAHQPPSLEEAFLALTSRTRPAEEPSQ